MDTKKIIDQIIEAKAYSQIILEEYDPRVRVGMEGKKRAAQSKLDELISELVREANDTSLESIDFSGLVTGYSKGTKTNGGDKGLVYYNDNSISSVLTKYNLYSFISNFSLFLYNVSYYLKL